ncbi:hypothetical protein [Bergeyella zoohelcum]|uniref:hypothetical protein n=1 Tax=Bergeyella zoohelcum TaxID=1015 RepID=UPI002A911307|nr:hypothetical protein [Bergeyella zoohelcum]MDY6026219.1 hypothetical protein [Bergeyella zoohelcum]
MKKFILLLGMATAVLSCKRAGDAISLDDEQNNLSARCNMTYNSNDAKDPWGVLIRTTCSPGPGTDVGTVDSAGKNSLLEFKNLTAKTKTKAVHFWFKGTDTNKLFKPITYARVFVFDDDISGNQKITQAQQQVQGGNHYLGFDSGVFKDIYPDMVLNINHKMVNGKVQSSYNLENEVKRALPVGKKIFIQFIVQKSPTSPVPSTFESAKYSYLVFTNEDNKAYPHYKIDLSDNSLGYQGHSFHYVQ